MVICDDCLNPQTLESILALMFFSENSFLGLIPVPILGLIPVF